MSAPFHVPCETSDACVLVKEARRWNTDLPEQQPMGDVLRQHEARDQVVDRPRLPAMWTQHERVEASLPAIIER